jgi:hypothetical protein
MTIASNDSYDINLLQHYLCADCRNALLPGPRGGMAQNFYCRERVTCGSSFNLTFQGGDLVFHHRIERPDDELYETYAKVWRR